MNNLVFTITSIKPIVRVLLLSLFPLFSYSQTFVGVSSTPIDGALASQAGTTATITPPAGMATGDLVIIYAHYRTITGSPSITTTGGQTWITETASAGVNNQTFGIFWCRFNGTWSTDPVVTGGNNLNPLSAVMYVYRPSSGVSTWGVHLGAANASVTNNAVTIAGVTTAVPNTVTMAFWASTSANTWTTLNGAGWLKTGLSAQNRNTVGVNGQSHTAAYYISATAVTVPNVRQTQSSSQATRTSIVSWYEIPPPPANDLCENAISLNSSPTCTNTSGTLNAGTTFTTTTNACGTNNDVWYSFVAKSANPTITVSANYRAQVMAGTCAGGFTAVGACPISNITSPTSLTVGATYYVRVYSTTNATGSFNICIEDPAPSNDICSAPVTLTSATSCTTTSGNFYGATVAATPGIATCTGPVVYDVWYRFTAQTTEPTITLSSIGTDIADARMQLLTNSCASPITEACGTTSISASNLTVGTTYLIRVYSASGSAPTSSTNAGFSICVTDPVPSLPYNDECANAITLPVGGSCSNVAGTVAAATASSVPVAPCTGPVGYDVWYKFTPVNATATITLSSVGANFTNARLQLFSGDCGSLSSLSCGITSIAATGLISGNTYFVRVYSTSASAPSVNANFNICITTTNPPPRFGNSYVNISKKTMGGVVEPGDTLEIRMTINHTSGILYSPRYLDSIPTNTQMIFAASDSGIRVITNEGLTYKKYTATPDVNDDAATYVTTPSAGQYHIRMNLGFAGFPPGAPASNSTTNLTGTTGRMDATTNRPRGGGGMLFATSFRVIVTGNYGDVIRLGAGKFIYKNAIGGADFTLTANPYEILISQPMSLCANSTGVNSAQESGGTFGSGTTLNRSSGLAFPIPAYTYVGNVSATTAVGDGRYAIVKNMSPRSGTNKDADRNPVNVYVLPDQRAREFRMFSGFWDIDGDHTGTNDAIGNAPPASSQSGGYMLMVNADYIASETYRQTLSNLCPNTYYEFSAWFRNICPTCGLDSTGTNYTPRQPGVLPNLTFALDGYDRYNTGEIAYSNINGNSGGWVKKGFVFITGPTQTSATFSIRNNSQGGGGNDWVMDDITVATCLPNMTYTPTLNPSVCEFNPITISNTMRSYFNNYNYYKWQRSTDGGVNWVDIPGESGSETPSLVGGQWEYFTSYTIPPTHTTQANNGDRYRQIVATTAANLNSSTCQATDGVSIVSLNVLPSCAPLSTDLLSFNGKLQNNHAQLSWTTSKEEEQIHFAIERSTDGMLFNRIATTNGYNRQRAENNHYFFTDPTFLSNMAYYRIAMINTGSKIKYSRAIQLGNNAEEFSVNVSTNLFDTNISFSVTVDKDAKIAVQLLDATGNVIKRKTYIAYAGLNNFSIQENGDISAGIYILQVQNKEKLLSKKLVKK